MVVIHTGMFCIKYLNGITMVTIANFKHGAISVSILNNKNLMVGGYQEYKLLIHTM